MHIQEGTNPTLTTCTKMTEEVDRKHGVNGNGSSRVIKDEPPAIKDVPLDSPAHTSTGGRLQFFKDGKFILELVRGCAREGERPGWVSVPRKTFWPPAAPPPHHHPMIERAPSLSVSDDNSSIQSSPWQRDHCWKQTNPRRNMSKELTMYYCRPSTLYSRNINAGSRIKRRRPLDTSHLDVTNSKRPLVNGHNGDAHSPSPEDSASTSEWTEHDKERYYHMKLKKPYQYHKLRVYKKTRTPFKRKELKQIVDKLEKLVAPPVNANLVACKQEHAMVSPRKRILREMEREEKRRPRPTPGPAPIRPTPRPPRAPHSYSITSLLSLSPPPRSPPRPAWAPPPYPLWPPYLSPLSPLSPLPPPPPLHLYPHHLTAPTTMDPTITQDLPLNLSKH